MNFKKIVSVISVFALSAALLVSYQFFAQAAEESPNRGERPTAMEEGGPLLCTRLDALVNNFNGRFGERVGRIEHKRILISENLEERRRERLEKLSQVRDGWDQNRAEFYAKVEARATTTEQLASVNAFEERIEAAIVARKTAIDEALEGFASDFDEAMQERREAIDEAQQTFEDAIDEAFDQARSDCDSSLAAASIRERLANSLRAAVNQYKDDLAEAGKLRISAEEQNKVRQEAIKKAISDYKQEVHAAIAELKSALLGTE